MQLLTVQPTTPPTWIAELLGIELRPHLEQSSPGLRLWSGERGGYRFVQLVTEDLGGLDPDAFEQYVARAYEALLSGLDAFEERHPVRLWNYVPHIHQEAGEGLNRYMRFNAGRHSAFSRRAQGDPEGFGSWLPTASAVGHSGEALVVQVLCCRAPGLPLENPRQVPAYRYSRRYGPLPPSFSRATALPADADGGLGRAVLIGGTASVVGEASRHAGDLAAQINETCRNIAAILAVAQGREDADHSDEGLERVRQLRVYVVRAEDTAAITDALQARFSAAERIEVMPALICREDLLVEVEALTAAVWDG